MTKYWVCDKCLPEEVEEFTLATLFKTPCVVCEESKEPGEMKCVRKLPSILSRSSSSVGT